MENEVSVKDLLTQEIGNRISELENLEVGTNEYEAAVDSLTKMLDKLNEMDKNEYSYWHDQDVLKQEKELKMEQLAQESEQKDKQLAEERKDRIVKNVLTGVSIIVGAGLTVWGTKASFEFEKEGTITTIMGRGFINNLLPKKYN